MKILSVYRQQAVALSLALTLSLFECHEILQ